MFFSIMLSNIAKIGVPVFLMISGALLIPKKETLKDLLLKRVLRILIVLVAVSLIYYIRLYIRHPEYGFSLKFFFTLIHGQPFITPFWFLYVYTAFLLILPFLRRMALSMTEQEYGYLMLLCLVFGFIMYPLNRLLSTDNYISLPILSMGIIYPLTGYYIDAVFDPGKISEHFIGHKSEGTGKYAAVALLILLLNSFLCIFLTYIDHSNGNEWSYKYIEGMIFIPAFCIFYIVRTLNIRSPLPAGLSGVIIYAGSCIFTVYLFEEILREDICINIYKLLDGSCPRLLLFIPYMLSIYALGIALSSLLKLIPGIKKWL